MFESIINRAQHSVESTLTKYILKALVAVPFIIAFGFGTAAASAKLVQLYGDVTGHAILAAGFVAIGLVAAGAISAMSDNAIVAAEPLAAVDANERSGISPASLFDADFLVATLGVVGPKAIPAIPVFLRFVVRNWALVLSAILVTYLLFADSEKVKSSPQ